MATKEKVLATDSEEVKLSPEQLEVISKKIKTNLTKENVTDKLIKDYTDEYMALTINGVEDKEGYDAVYTARQTTKNTRILISRICKEGRAPAQQEAKAWIEKEKELVAKVVVIENHLQAQEDAYNSEKERIKKEKKDAEDARYRVRVMQLLGLGAINNGVEIVSDEVVYEVIDIRESDEDFYVAKILPKYQAIFDAKEKIRLANEKAIQEEKDRQQKIQDDLKKQQDELKIQQDEIRKQQEKIDKEKNDAIEKQRLEEKKKADDKMKSRLNQLMSMGLKFDFEGGYYVNFDVFIHTLDITGYDDKKWDELIIKTTKHIEDYKAQEAEKNAERIEKERQESIQRGIDEQKEKDRLAELKRKEEMDASNDRTKYAEILAYLKATPIYEMKSGPYRQKLNVIRDFIADLK